MRHSESTEQRLFLKLRKRGLTLDDVDKGKGGVALDIRRLAHKKLFSVKIREFGQGGPARIRKNTGV